MKEGEMLEQILPLNPPPLAKEGEVMREKMTAISIKLIPH
jgi:hypothetical protein